MIGFIVIAVLWLVLGLVAVWALGVATIAGTAVTAMYASEADGPKWVPVVWFPLGIILTLSAFILVVIMVVTNIVNAVNAGG